MDKKVVYKSMSGEQNVLLLGRTYSASIAACSLVEMYYITLEFSRLPTTSFSSVTRLTINGPTTSLIFPIFLRGFLF